MGIYEKIFVEDELIAMRRKMKDPLLDYGPIKYMGGHKMYPAYPKNCEIYFYEDRFEIKPLNLIIPYSEVKDIADSNEMKRDADRLFLGLIALPLALSYLRKKNHIHTIVQYNDGLDIQNIVIDFENNVNYAQALIYKKMLEHRMKKESTDSNNPKLDVEKREKKCSPF